MPRETTERLRKEKVGKVRYSHHFLAPFLGKVRKGEGERR